MNNEELRRRLAGAHPTTEFRRRLGQALLAGLASSRTTGQVWTWPTAGESE